MSSRNRYLDADQRSRATAIYRGLAAADAAYRSGERNAEALQTLALAPIAVDLDAIDYVTLADAETLRPSLAEPSQPLRTAPVVLLVAARLGTTRLIDNAVLGQDALG
jgi:pantoate--beta-alanine ligase